MTQRHITLIVAGLLSLCAGSASAAPARYDQLGLEQALRIALDNHRAMQVSRAATEMAEAQYRQAMAAFGPRLGLEAGVQRAELAGVGLLAGLLASGVAMAVGWAMARYAFDFSWTASPWVPLVGGAVGAALALLAGWWGLREVLRRPVVETLRRAAQ